MVPFEPVFDTALEDSDAELHMLSRGCLLWALALAVPFDLAHADEAGPAVETANGEVTFIYAYSAIEEGRSRTDLIELTVFKISSHEPGLSARFTVPLGDHFGARLSAFGSLPLIEIEGESDLAGFADGRAEVFWRDPSLGYLDVGYHFVWLDLPFAGQVASHGATVGAGVFVPDLGLGKLDWTASFEYAREELTGPGISRTSFDVYSLNAGPRWYMTETFLASSAFTWSRTELSGARVGTQLAGSLQLNWLIGPPAGRYVSIGVFGSLGRRSTDIPSPFPDVDQNFYTVGGSLSVYVVPVRSFIQLLRNLR